MIPDIKKVDKRPAKKVHFPLSIPKERAGMQDVFSLRDFSGVDPQGLAPIEFETVYAGKHIYFSKPYRYKTYPVVFAYVEDEAGTLQPRLLYHSQSRAQWRIAPTTKGKFGKGYANEMDINLPPKLNIALSHHFKQAIELPSSLDSHEDMNAFVAAFTRPPQGRMEASVEYMKEVPIDMYGGKNIVDYPEEAFARGHKQSFAGFKKNDEKRSLPSAFKSKENQMSNPAFTFKTDESLVAGIKKKEKKTVPPQGYGKVGSFGFLKPEITRSGYMVLRNPSSIKIQGDEGFLPDVENGIVFQTHIENPFYNHVFHEGSADKKGMNVYCVESKDKQYQYLIAECEQADETFRFVLSVANNPCDLTSFLVPKQFVNLGHRMAFPAIRAGEDLIKMHSSVVKINALRMPGHGLVEYNDENYMDISPYTKQLPLNAYLTCLPSMGLSDDADSKQELAK